MINKATERQEKKRKVDKAIDDRIYQVAIERTSDYLFISKARVRLGLRRKLSTKRKKKT